jgi:GrpB-like predicted nucleotidyltransferase (UPF0157 family)
MDLRPESEIRAAVAAVAGEQRARIEASVPGAEVEHIGSTAVPGALTKGDLDLLVRVPQEEFERAAATLAETYTIHQPENWTTVFASFKEVPEGEVPVGIQLVLAGGMDERLFRAWRDRLSADPVLLERYNALKRSLRDADPDAYIGAKAHFIEAVIGDGLGSEGESADPRRR